MLWPRIISGVIAIALALATVVLGGWYFTAAFCILIYLGQKEYFVMTRAKGMAPAAKMTLIVSQILMILSNLSPALADPIFPVAGTFICFYLLFQPKFATIADISASIMGLFYGGYLPSYWVRLRDLQQSEFRNLPLDGFWVMQVSDWWHPARLPQGLTVVLLAFACIWAADIGGYVFGRLFGRTKFTAISPKKTVEGAVMGVFGSVLVASYGAWVLGWSIAPLSGTILGLVIGVVSVLGDLTESMMKRDAGFKDSGDLIPGHGGILDRTDSYVFIAPLVYYFVTLILPRLPR
jgi:phosphatidate cytidylyltransferase